MPSARLRATRRADIDAAALRHATQSDDYAAAADAMMSSLHSELYFTLLPTDLRPRLRAGCARAAASRCRCAHDIA